MVQSSKLKRSTPSPPLATFHLQSSQWGEMKMVKGTKVIGFIFENGTRRHIDGLDGIGIVWEYDRAFTEGRKDPVCHPLDRNRLQTQDMEGLEHREVNIR